MLRMYESERKYGNALIKKLPVMELDSRGQSDNV